MSDHPEYAGLLRAVLEDPQGDGARLLLADWLEDHGDAPRAEFVRVQVELARTPVTESVPERPDQYGGFSFFEEPNPRYHELCRLQDGLVRAHMRRWLQHELPDVVSRDYDRWKFEGGANAVCVSSKRDDDAVLTWRRGFLCTVRLTPADFLASAEALFRLQPVTTVCLSGRVPAGYPPQRPVTWEWVYRARKHSDPAPPALPFRLHADLFEKLAAGEPSEPPGVRTYKSRREAEADLSRAAVALGRERAGLPPLKE